MQIKKALENFGLKNKEIDVYLACLELKFFTVQNLAEKTKIKRTTIYDILEDLMTKKLVNQTKEGKKRLFYAEDPKKIIEILDKQKGEILQIMPDLSDLYKTSETLHQSKIYEGFDELKALFEGLFTENPFTTIQVFGLNELLQKEEFIQFFKFYHGLRRKNDIKLLLLLSKKVKKDFEEKYIAKRWIFGKDEVKFVNFTFPGGVFIFSDHVINITYGDQVIAHDMQSTNNAEKYKNFFKKYWNKK